jgi:hypothetical protein
MKHSSRDVIFQLAFAMASFRLLVLDNLRFPWLLRLWAAAARVMLECCIFGLQLLQVFLQWEWIENNVLRYQVDGTL